MGRKYKGPAKYYRVVEYNGRMSTQLANKHFCISYSCNDIAMYFSIAPVIDVYNNGDLYMLPFIKNGHRSCTKKEATKTVAEWLEFSAVNSTAVLHLLPVTAYFDKVNRTKDPSKRKIISEEYTIFYEPKEMNPEEYDGYIKADFQPSIFSRTIENANIKCDKVSSWDLVSEFICDGGLNMEA